MNNITKKSAILAVIGAVTFVLFTNYGQKAPSRDTRDANVDAAAFVAAMDPTAPVANDRVGPDQMPDYSGIDTGPSNYAVEPYVALPALQGMDTGARKLEKQALTKQQSARAKMSGPVAALAAAGGSQTADLIVSYDEHPELFEDGRIESLGGEIVRHYEVLKLLAVRLPAESLVDFAIDENVDRVSLDDAVAATSISSRETANAPVYPAGNAYWDGYNVGVAILDSGVAHHRDLSGYLLQYSFLDGHYPEPEIDDDELEYPGDTGRVDYYGHGTHIAGIIAGYGKYSSGDYRGIAGNSRILSLQVLDQNGQGSMSDVMAALDWLLNYGSYFNIRVANLSLGKPVTESNTTDPLVLAIEQVWDSGIVVAVAAGNYGREGYFSTTSPGNSRKVITVGALTDNDTGNDPDDDYVSTYSSKGPTPGDHVAKPDLVAPGNRLIATTPSKSILAELLPGQKVSCTVASYCDYNYLMLSGTSMATGMVSAAAAMMLEKDPTLSPSTVKARLMRSARKIDESPVVAGAGLLDVDAALNQTGVVDGDALSPLLAYDAETGGTLIEDTSVLWGDDLWGAGFLWTDGGGVSANGYIWTDGGAVSANGYIWTDGSIWANGYLWTDGSVAAFGYMWTDGVNANGYLWTDGGAVRGLSLFDLYSANPSLNDDEPTSD